MARFSEVSLWEFFIIQNLKDLIDGFGGRPGRTISVCVFFLESHCCL